VLSLCLASCDDVLEPDIADEQVQALVPIDGAKVHSAEVVFRWEAVAGARSYRLQLASPSFEQPGQFYMDTVSAQLSLSLPLQPGAYEWRVQALNAGYETEFTTRTFSLDSASSLAKAQVRLLSPVKDGYTNKQEVLFSWEPVTLAEKYVLEILSQPKFDTIVYAASVRKTLPREGRKYEWRVRALNATGAAISPQRSFTTDFEAPGTAELLYPQADTAVSTWPVALKWRRKASDVVADSVYLYQADQAHLVSGFPKMTTVSNFSLSSGLSLAPGNYFWAVKSVDRAGNGSGITIKRRFSVR